MGWESCDWSKPSRAVVACDGKGNGCVLWTVGAHVACDIDQIGPRLDDIGLDDAPAGISVWEGVTKGGGRAYDGDYNDTYLEGTFRALTADEWAAVAEGQSPWNAVEWLDVTKADSQ